MRASPSCRRWILLEGDIAIQQGSQTSSVDTLLSRIETAPQRLADSANKLLAPVVADDMVDALYRYAARTDVNIAELTVNSPQNSDNALVHETVFLLRATGAFLDLTRFVGAIEEARAPGFVLSNLEMTTGAETATLTATVTLYTSPLSTTIPGAAPAAESDGAAVAPAPPPDPRQHRVIAGETLLGIANAYRVPLDALRAANGLQSDALQAGQLLTIPH